MPTSYGSVNSHGIYVANSCVNPVVRGNELYNNYKAGVHFNGDISSAPGDGIVHNALVENNIGQILDLVGDLSGADDPSAAINGLITYGLPYWKAPALSFVIYMMPIPALLVGYSFFKRDEQLVPLLIFYAVLTSLSLVGVMLEYRGVHWQALGLVAAVQGGNVRMLPGIQLEMLSGFYRAPDILAWHAATLTMIGIALAVRARVLRAAAPWMVVAAWGVLACFLSGRRKALYTVVVFIVVFVWRYARRLTLAQLVSFATLGLGLVFVTHRVATSERAEHYVRAAATTQEEVLSRLEGGFTGTIEQYGVMGAGLGTATQGTQHFGTGSFSWQEGGLSKLAIELGLPGVATAMLLLVILIHYMLKITRAPDEPGTSQLIRCMLMAMMIANVGNFLASAQAYSDPVLTLVTSFFGGCLLATAATESRLANEAAPTPTKTASMGSIGTRNLAVDSATDVVANA